VLLANNVEKYCAKVGLSGVDEDDNVNSPPGPNQLSPLYLIPSSFISEIFSTSAEKLPSISSLSSHSPMPLNASYVGSSSSSSPPSALPTLLQSLLERLLVMDTGSREILEGERTRLDGVAAFTNYPSTDKMLRRDGSREERKRVVRYEDEDDSVATGQEDDRLYRSVSSVPLPLNGYFFYLFLFLFSMWQQYIYCGGH
jgi:hypothetical protein